MNNLTHLDGFGRVRMMDVSSKQVTPREAVATASIYMCPKTMDLISQGEIGKGNVLETARIAGIMAAKKVSEIIPMCHTLNVEYAEVNFTPDRENGGFNIESLVKIAGKTGVEMEALLAVSVAALTIYDMCKSVDKSMSITDIRLVRKSGGKSNMPNSKNLYGKNNGQV